MQYFTYIYNWLFRRHKPNIKTSSNTPQFTDIYNNNVELFVINKNL